MPLRRAGFFTPGRTFRRGGGTGRLAV